MDREVDFVDIAYDEIPPKYYKEKEVRSFSIIPQIIIVHKELILEINITQGRMYRI